MFENQLINNKFTLKKMMLNRDLAQTREIIHKILILNFGLSTFFMFGPLVGFVFFGIGCTRLNKMLKLLFSGKSETVLLANHFSMQTPYSVLCLDVLFICKQLRHVLGLLEYVINIFV